MSSPLTRRKFIKLLCFLSLGLLNLSLFEKLFRNIKPAIASDRGSKNKPTNDNGVSIIYEAKNGTPEQNVKKVIEMMGGIETIIGKEDIVILKPNAQWWNQGTTNTDAMRGFIDLVLAIPNFKGELIIADNHQFYSWKHGANIRGWSTQKRNGRFNLNELIDYFQKRGYRNVTKYSWISSEICSADIHPENQVQYCFAKTRRKLFEKHGRVVESPANGDGYVWTDIEYRYDGKKTKMTYPIFTSEYSKTTIDFKNGAWRGGKYTGQPVKFINFAGLNHHSKYAGVTSSVKNYLGCVDMSCGYIGTKPAGYVNFHFIGVPGLGGAVGTFINTIRKADLNIITAELVGYSSRTDLDRAARTKTMIASTDPVALDYYGAKQILYPLGGPVASLNDPDNKKGPFRQYLNLCAEQGIGTLEENKMKAITFDCQV